MTFLIYFKQYKICSKHYSKHIFIDYQIDDTCLQHNKCIDDGYGDSMWQLIAPECIPIPIIR